MMKGQKKVPITHIQLLKNHHDTPPYVLLLYDIVNEYNLVF